MARKFLNGVDVAGQRVQNVGTAAVATDAVSLGQLESLIAGLSAGSGGGSHKFATTIGDGSTTSIPVTHGLNSIDVSVAIYLVATGESVEADVVRTSANVVTLTFGAAPASGAVRVVVQG